jgi:REP element-mobilizing transposase RayT
MSNVHRLRTSDRIFFITTNLTRASDRFETWNTRSSWTIAKARKRLGFLFCGYVLMPDHWHALIATQHPLTIPDVLQDIKRVSSFKINRLRETRGSRWQHQFWDRFVRHSKEFAERVGYMHYNPVRKVLEESPEQWRWSSANNFSLDKAVVQLPDEYRA